MVLPKIDPGRFDQVYGAYCGQFGSRFYPLGASQSPTFALWEPFGPVLGRFGPFWPPVGVGVPPKWPTLGPKNAGNGFSRKVPRPFGKVNGGIFRPIWTRFEGQGLELSKRRSGRGV